MLYSIRYINRLILTTGLTSVQSNTSVKEHATRYSANVLEV